jgi:hypothetical protein
MIENYKFDKLAGPSGVMAGYILIFFGLITLYFTLTAIPVIILGGLMAFSYKGSRIKFDKKRYQNYLSLFGFIRIGVWLPFEKSDAISVQQFKGKNTSFSRSNRKTDAEVREFRIILNSSYNDKAIPIAQFQNEQEAKEKAEELKSLVDGMKI